MFCFRIVIIVIIIIVIYLTAITNAAKQKQWVFFVQSCRQTRMFTFSGEIDHHFVLTVCPAELKSRLNRCCRPASF